MLVSIITTVVESIFLFVVWMGLLFILKIIFRLRLKGIIFQLFFHSLVVGSFVHLMTISNPLQNYNIIMGVIALYYIFLFFVFPKLEKKQIKIWKLWSKSLFSVFLFLILIAWKWEFLDSSSSQVLSEKLKLWIQWELMYKSFDGIHSSMWVYSEYGESTYDTIKYDMDLDWFVDLKMVDINEDSEIDEVIFYTYNAQKYILFCLLILFIVGTFLWVYQDAILKKDKEKEDNGDIKDLKKKKVLDEEKSVESEIKKEQEKEEWKKGDKVNKKEKKENESKNNTKKIIAISLLFSLILSQFNLTYALTEQEINAQMQLTGAQAQKCAQDPFDDSLCSWVSKSARLNLQHMQNPKYVSEAEVLMKKQQQCYVSPCSEQKIIQMQQEYKAFVQKWEKIKPINFWNTTTWVAPSIPVTNNSVQNDNSWSNWVVWTLENFDDLDNIVNEAKKIINDELDGKPASELISEWINIIKQNINSWGNKNNWTVSGSKDKSPPLTLEDVTKLWKNAVDVGEEILKWVNSALESEIHLISSQKTPNWQSIKNIEHVLEKNIGKAPWFYTDVVDALKRLKWSEKKAFQEAMEKIWKIKKVAKVLPIVWTVFETYNDYVDIERTFPGDSNKVYVATTYSSIGKFFVSKNPADVWIDIISWVAGLMWFTEVSDTMQDYSLWNRFKDIVKDAYTDDGASIMDTLVQSASDTKNVLNNPNSGVLDKWLAYSKFMVTVWYGWTVATARGIFNWVTSLFF